MTRLLLISLTLTQVGCMESSLHAIALDAASMDEADTAAPDERDALPEEEAEEDEERDEDLSLIHI